MPHSGNCHSHSGHIEKINGFEKKLDEGFKSVKSMQRFTIGLLLTFILGVITSWWNMNTTLSTVSGKMSVYDKLFETKITALSMKTKE